MFMGYAENHCGNVYCMLNPETNRFVMSCHINWLENLWGESNKVTGTTKMMINNYSYDKEDNTDQSKEEKVTDRSSQKN